MTNKNKPEGAESSPPDSRDEPIPFVLDGLPEKLEILKAPDLFTDEDHPDHSPSADWEDVPDFTLGEDAGLIKLTSIRQLRGGALRLLKQATREMLLVTPDLEFPRFDNEDFVLAVSELVRRSKYTVCRILVGDPLNAIREHHRLIPLLRRMSSRIEIRQLHADDHDAKAAWMVVDNIAVLRCTDRQPWQGGLTPRSAADAKRLREQFHIWWERAALIPDFREFRA